RTRMMNPEDVGKILAVAAMYDRRKVGKTDILAWGESLDGLDPRGCAEAIRAHYTDPDTCSAYLLPGHVRGRIRQTRREQATRERNAGTLRQLESSARAAEESHVEAHRAAQECKAAFAAAIASKHPNDER